MNLKCPGGEIMSHKTSILVLFPILSNNHFLIGNIDINWEFYSNSLLHLNSIFYLVKAKRLN